METSKTISEADKQKAMEFFGFTHDKLRELFTQGLEDFVTEYDGRTGASGGSRGYSPHWGDVIPEKIAVEGSQYSPHELLEHFKRQDGVGSRIFRIMETSFGGSSQLTGVVALGLMNNFKGRPGNLRAFSSEGEADYEQMWEDARSLDIKVNPTLRMAIYGAVKALYFTPQERKEQRI